MPDTRCKIKKLCALQKANELFFMGVLKDLQGAATHSNRDEILPRDVKLAVGMKGWNKELLEDYKARK